MNSELTPLSFGPLTVPTYEMVMALKDEAMSFLPGRFRVALLNEAKNLEKRIAKLREMDGRQ